MTVTADQAIAALTQTLGYTPSLEQVAVAFLSVDQAQVATETAARIRWERWDRESPINNVSAEEVLVRRDDYKGGEIYLIYVDDRLVFFQPFSPVDGSSILEDELEATATAHVDQVVADMTFDATLEALVEHLPTQE